MKLIYALAASAALLMLGGCGEVVDAGNYGVRVVNGAVEQKPLPEGFYWYFPFTTSINEVSAKSRAYTDEVQSTTRDLQIVTLKFNANYRQQPSAIPKIFQTKGDDWPEQLVRPAVTSILKSALAGYRAPDVVANQARIQYQVAEQVRRRLNAVGVVLDGFDITSISFSEDYAKAIEAKEVAVQQAAAAVNQTAVIREKGNQQVIAAEANAKAIQLESQALQSSPNYVSNKWVDKWDGDMPDTVYCTSAMPCVGAPK